MKTPLLLARVSVAAAAGLTLCGAAPLSAAAATDAPRHPAVSASASAATAAGATAAPAGIAWRQATSDADVDAAFAAARAARKPVFVYWGASWCPPCNQVKATVFNRQDFIARSRAFVAVYVDGDSPGAQKLGARFKVAGYPTMVLFTPAGAELTRLPGEVDGATITQVLTLAMNAERPVQQVLAQALSGPRGAARLGAADWRLLSFYSWDTDEQRLAKKAELPALLRRLADACPAALQAPATRLRLKALAADGAALAAARKAPTSAAAAPLGVPIAPVSDPSVRRRVLAVLADTALSRADMDVLTNYAVPIVDALGGVGVGVSVGAGESAGAATRATPAARAELVAAFEASLSRLQHDATLSRADRLTALLARVQLAGKPAPAALVAEVRDAAARADREVRDAYERQAVLPAAADLLLEAGLADESDALLKANLARSHAPYYLMAGLAYNARQRGDQAAAVDWSAKAFDAAQGPATRLQWGASYLKALVDYAPADAARIERVARQVFGEAAGQPDAFFERSGRSLQRVADQLVAWNATGTHAAVLARLQAEVATACRKLPPGDPPRARCDALFTPVGGRPA